MWGSVRIGHKTAMNIKVLWLFLQVVRQLSGVAKQAEIDHRQMHIAWRYVYPRSPFMSTKIFAAPHKQEAVGVTTPEYATAALATEPSTAHHVVEAPRRNTARVLS
jgi:hypothetical protein